MAEQRLGLDTTLDPATQTAYDPASSTPPPGEESFDDLADDGLVEDVSIDGMCGVY